MTPLRYLGLLGVQVRVSVATAMQYRVDFLGAGVMSLYWLGWNLLPLTILYASRESVAGWTVNDALIVMAWFIILRGLLEGLVNPSLVDMVERIRTGSFDYVLLKPADAQFLVSTSRFAPWRIVDVLGGIGLAVYAFVQIGRPPGVIDLAAGLLLLASGAMVMYALWIVMVSASFWVVRLDNLAYLLSAVFDTARWPVQVFRGFWRFLFTFILPLALMTTFPARAILGRLDGTTTLACLAAAVGLGLVARLVWRAAIRNYTSASS
jgi:ABC-2 type transport system permease protein